MRFAAFRRRAWTSFKRGLIFSLPAGAVFVLLQWSTYSALDLWPLSFYIYVYYLLYFFFMWWALVGIVGILSPPRDRRGISRLIFSITFLVIGFICIGFSFEFHKSALLRCTERASPLISAIQKYEQRYGRPPDELKSLVPDFITAIPSPGVRFFSDFRYQGGAMGNKGWDIGDNSWCLWVDTPETGLDFSTLFYFPDHKYPAQIGGLHTCPIGDWAYGID